MLIVCAWNTISAFNIIGIVVFCSFGFFSMELTLVPVRSCHMVLVGDAGWKSWRALWMCFQADEIQFAYTILLQTLHQPHDSSSNIDLLQHEF